MEIGIIGLPRSGKTTVFNALTKGNASLAGYSAKANVGVAKVPDERLNVLARMYGPRKVVPAEITYTDVPPPPEGFGKTRGIGGEYLNALQATDALMLIVRSFKDSSIPHIDETIDPTRDAENMMMEMAISDMEMLDRRLIKINESFKGAKAQQREALIHEQQLLSEIKIQLAEGIALRDQHISTENARLMAGFGFLSMKPMIIAENTGEDQLSNNGTPGADIAGVVSGARVRITTICAQFEMEMSKMESDDEIEFRSSYGSEEASLDRMVRLSYEVVDQISFFTVGEDECRAWEVARNSTAQIAAGKIHSDLQRGFIRAEVIAYGHLIECGGLVEAKKRGLLRQEGKEYIVKDGEIMHILFNV
jgi:GTP-binding protein YchF